MGLVIGIALLQCAFESIYVIQTHIIRMYIYVDYMYRTINTYIYIDRSDT